MAEPSTTTEPGCQSLRERKKNATRVAIHEVALRLVAEHGLAGFTVEQICSEVGVSPRTFFNYYPSKIAAAFDLVVADIGEEARERYLASSGNLVGDTCDLVAHSLTLPVDYPRIKTLMGEQPDLGLTFWQQMISRLKPFYALVEERCGDPRTAGLAFGAMVIAVNSVTRWPGGTTPEEIAVRLRQAAAAMAELITD